VSDLDRLGSHFLPRLDPQRGRSIGGAAERAKNFSSFSLGASVATFIGPSLAGIAIDALGFRPTFIVLA